jgi:hypothetical protein
VDVEELEKVELTPLRVVESVCNMRKVITSATYSGSKGEINNSPSLTVPDQTLTIRELLQRHTRGLPMPSHKLGEPMYNEDFELPDMKTLDLVERDELKMKIDEQITENQQTIKNNSRQLKEYYRQSEGRKQSSRTRAPGLDDGGQGKTDDAS